MIQENVLICGVVKNCGNKLTNNINLALETGKLFNTFMIIIYENNSTDNTKYILQQYSTSKFFKIISEDLDDNIIKSESKIWAYTAITGSDHPCRIEQICNARNNIIKEINKPEYNNYSYVIWIDLDSNGWSIEGITNSFHTKNEWDVIYANGIDNTRNYYDLYALRCNMLPFGPEIIGETFWNNMKKVSLQTGNFLIPVFSAFGGLGIFKKHIFNKYNYDCIVNDNVKYFYRNYLKNNNINQSLLDIICNSDYKFKIGYKDDETNVVWKSNSGYNKPVVCEHVTLNFQLYNNGYRIFINPNMIYFR